MIIVKFLGGILFFGYIKMDVYLYLLFVVKFMLCENWIYRFIENFIILVFIMELLKILMVKVCGFCWYKYFYLEFILLKLYLKYSVYIL